MRTLFAICLVLSMQCASVSWAEGVELQNPGFEESADKPANWDVSQHAGEVAYETAIDEKVFFEGKRSFRMKQTSKQTYGLLRQIIATPDSAGKALHLSAMLRSEKVGEQGWLLVVNFLTKRGGIISQVRSEPVTGDTDWSRVNMIKSIPKRTGRMSIGVMLLDDGAGWVDDVQIKIK